MFAKVKGIIHSVIPGDRNAEAHSESPLCAPGFWEVIPLDMFRQRQDVTFCKVPMERFCHQCAPLNGIDHVRHGPNAQSPGYVKEKLGWYMHPHQQDNLIVLEGTRTMVLRRTLTDDEGRRCAEAATREEVFHVTPTQIKRNGVVIHNGPAILRWEPYVLHRVTSGPEGSTSLNFAVRTKHFDIDHEFDIYHFEESLDSGLLTVIRKGKKDQKILQQPQYQQQQQHQEQQQQQQQNQMNKDDGAATAAAAPMTQEDKDTNQKPHEVKEGKQPEDETGKNKDEKQAGDQ